MPVGDRGRVEWCEAPPRRRARSVRARRCPPGRCLAQITGYPVPGEYIGVPQCYVACNAERPGATGRVRGAIGIFHTNPTQSKTAPDRGPYTGSRRKRVVAIQ
ncbi:hypothetical protein GCM10009838_07220 [Catenulispora subtropica]|uniref:Uncharacterized protein n=1 Tax=Catenulispora subtropica TaxID=450798 RepID=A0ABP5C172_9ACTN